MPDDVRVPCAYKRCISFAKTTSGLGYCAIHHLVACDEVMFQKALTGQISPTVKEFAQELERGSYAKGF